MEHKLAGNEYLEGYTTYKEGTKSLAENKGKCYYLVLQQYPSELNTKLKNSAPWEAAAMYTDCVALLLIMLDVMHNKKEWAHSKRSLAESNTILYIKQQLS